MYIYVCGYRIREKLGLDPVAPSRSLSRDLDEPPGRPISSSSTHTHTHAHSVRSVKIAMYNYGSPRTGNAVFASHFNRHVPNSFRVAVDGDIITGIPKGNYKHVGTNILVDGLGVGSIIIDPSYIERRLRSRTKAHVSVHSLIIYRQGLLGIRAAAEYMRGEMASLVQRQASSDSILGQLDTVKIALGAGNLYASSVLGEDMESGVKRSQSQSQSQAQAAAQDGTESSLSRGSAPDSLSLDPSGGLSGHPSFHRKSTGVLSDPGDTRTLTQEEQEREQQKDARHLQHDNELYQELFASIRSRDAHRGALTPLMKRSIQLFRFPGKKHKSQGAATQEGNQGEGGIFTPRSSFGKDSTAHPPNSPATGAGAAVVNPLTIV